MIGFAKRAARRVEERNFRTPFFILSVLLTLAAVYAIIDEAVIRRPWKEYQREFASLRVTKLRSEYMSALQQLDSARLRDLREALRTAETSEKSEEYRSLTQRKDLILEQVFDATKAWQFARSEADAEAYRAQRRRIREGTPVSPDERLKALDHRAAQLGSTVDSLQRELQTVEASRRKLELPADSVRSIIGKMEEPLKRLRGALSAAGGLNPEIRQVVLPDFDRTGFGEFQSRVDRCQTCHLGVRDSLMSDAPQPFTAHPFPELLRIHDPTKFGCSPCHRGQPYALTPASAHGEDDWEKPILRGGEAYASCSDCHTGRAALNGYPSFSFGRQVLIESGCAGCHTISQFGELPKIGPSLRRIRSKDTRSWTKAWLMAPHRYDPFARMPDFRLTSREADAITAYLYASDTSGRRTPPLPTGALSEASVKRGGTLFTRIGCVGCHTIGSTSPVHSARGTTYDFGPSLTQVGSKLSAAWVYAWITNPLQYDSAAHMPNLRLSPSEASDLTAYLMTLRDSAAPPDAAPDSLPAKTVSLGGKLIREFGCFGCHDINGMDNESKVSVDLSDFGRKKTDEMDFGYTAPLGIEEGEADIRTSGPHVSVRRTWAGWVYGKLFDSRLFQTDRIVQRMPVYAFSDSEILALRVVLTSLRSDIPSPEYRVPSTEKYDHLSAGERITVARGCINCHTIEGRGGFVSASLDDPFTGPPVLTVEGAKVQEPWLYRFLKNPAPLRPWLSLRMPTFALGEKEENELILYFLAMDGESLLLRDYAAFAPEPDRVTIGRRLFGVFQCAQCHNPASVKLGARTVGPDLRLVAGRLKPEWVVAWLRDPQTIQPGTMMPTYFPDGQSPVPGILSGDARQQMEALRDYLFSLKTGTVTTEMLRRK